MGAAPGGERPDITLQEMLVAFKDVVARAESQPKSRRQETLRDVMEAYALAPLAVTVDGKPLVPTSIRAKLVDEGVVVLVTYASPPTGKLAVIPELFQASEET